MLTTLNPFTGLVDAGSYVTKPEAIKRYRQIASFNYFLLQLLCAVQFSILGKDDKGELYLC
jgi:hypothetical protein